MYSMVISNSVIYKLILEVYFIEWYPCDHLWGLNIPVIKAGIRLFLGNGIIFAIAVLHLVYICSLYISTSLQFNSDI